MYQPDSPSKDLPEHLFAYISSITPMINIDIVLRNPSLGILYAWRDDGTYGPGWHVPGGIIRHKESFVTRIHRTASQEASISQLSHIQLLQVNQIMNPERDYRGHFVSFLFTASTIASTPDSANLQDKSVRWFSSIPTPLIPQHERYRHILSRLHSNPVSITDDQLSGNILDVYSPSMR